MRKRMSTRPWRRLRAHILARDPICKLCAEADRLTLSCEVDHIVPIHLGGSDSATNLRGLCHDCHARITAQQLRDLVREQNPKVGEDGWPVYQRRYKRERPRGTGGESPA